MVNVETVLQIIIKDYTHIAKRENLKRYLGTFMLN